MRDEEVLSPSDSVGTHNIPVNLDSNAITNNRYDKSLTYGDLITVKTENILRIGFQNFGGFSAYENDPIDQSLRKWIADWDFDVFGISEVNIYWPNIKQSLQFLDRVYSWFPPLNTRACFSFNSGEKRLKRSLRQFGGTAQIARGNAALRHQSTESDVTGLGRWVSQTFMGKDQRILRVVTAYRPNAAAANKLYSVFRQQWAAFIREKRKEDPREALLTDLTHHILKWKEKGENIVLMIDMNEDVRSPRVTQFLDDVGMREVILERHGQEAAPRTYIRGSRPIDGIFATHSVDIVTGGYSAFDEGVQGKRADHRCLWIDVQVTSVFGHKMPGPVKFAGRRVNGKDPRTYAKFRDSYKRRICSTGLAKRIFQLERRAIYPLPIQLQREAEIVSTMRTEALQGADNDCRQLHFGGASYTPEFARLEATVKTLDLLVKRRSQGKVNAALIRRQHKKSKMGTTLSSLYALTPQQLRKEAVSAYKEYRRYWLRHNESRDNWLADLAAARATAEIKSQDTLRHTGTTKRKKRTLQQRTATQIKALRCEERSKRLWARIKRGVGKDALAGISMVLEADQNGNWIPRTHHKDITAALIAENKRKYHQTENTPPMRSPVQLQLGYLGIGKEAREILKGRYVRRPNTDDATAALLQNLSFVTPNTPPIPLGISTEDYQQGWKRMKEKTSAGGSTLHFGHCKAIAADDDLSSMEAAFISIPMKSGYTYNAWENGVDCVLPKKKNSLHVSDLRTIVLLEADFNFLNKHIARKVMMRAELSRQGIAPEQYGSRRFFRAIDQVLNKVWSFDLLRQFKQPGIVIPTDLKSCYDRICHSIASLCLQRQGVSEPEVICMFSTLQRMKHTIRCAYGNSDEHYGTELWAVPMQGVYQGNGAGPAIWAVVSSPVLQILRQEGYGAFFKASISGEEIQLVGYAFVDDTDLIQTGQDQSETYRSVLMKAQQALNRWEGLIKSTGGALNVAKCRWWAVDFEWAENGSWQYRREVELPGTLTAKDYDDNTKTVKRLSHEEAYETLGVFVAPTGDHSVEYKYLLDKARVGADKLRTSTFQDVEAATALKATILKTLEYPLPALFLTDNECNTLMSTILRAALPKAKFNRNTCRRTLYAPGSHGGQEISNLRTSQLIAHVDAVLRHGPASTISGQQFRATMEIAKVELGLPGPLFQHDFKEFGHLITQSWVKNAWREFQVNQVTVSDHTEHLTPARVGDAYLIHSFHQAGFRNSNLFRLSRCKNRLRVNLLSDITSGDGRFILKEATNDGFPAPNTTLNWPSQGPLPSSYWKLWARALKKAFPTRKNGSLRIPLGRWFHPTPHHTITAKHDPIHRITYVRDKEVWHSYHHTPRTITGPNRFEYRGRFHEPPAHARRAVAWVHRGSLVFHGSAPILPKNEPVRTSLYAAIQQLAKEWYWAVEHVEWNIDPQDIARAIRNGTARAITDGSFKAGKGTAAFAIVDNTCQQGIYCMQRTPGPHYAQCSYRSENGGIIGILLVLRLLHQVHSLDGGNIIIGCDNIESGRHCLEYDDPCRPTVDHYDMLAAATELRADLPFRPQYHHVEGHQSTRYPKRKLDAWAILNEEMDARAKAYWLYTESQPRPQACRPNEWTVEYQGQRIVTQFNKRFRRLFEAHQLENKWLNNTGTRRHPVPPMFMKQQVQSIDFNASQRAWDTNTPSRQRFITKLLAKQLPTGRRMQQYKFWDSSACPICRQDNETTDHVYSCADPRSIQNRAAAVEDLEIQLRKIGTASDIVQCLVMVLRSQLLQHPIDRNQYQRQDVRRLIGQQLKLGNSSLLHGRLSLEWATAQQTAFRNYAPWRSGKSWAASVINLLWAMSFSIWEHRNSILHATVSNHPDINTDEIDLAVLEEWTMGPDPMWDPGSKSLFQGITCEAVLNKPIHSRMQWLYYVQLARQSAPDESF